MSNLVKLNINPKKLMNNENLLALKGGAEPGLGTCAFKDPDGYVFCGLTKWEALFMYDPYGPGSGANWCCDSCPTTSWWIAGCGNEPD
jgi:hypothetical protein